ncbi:MAG: transposase [Bacteroidales bacterium]
MGRKSKFDQEMKLEVVQEYLDGKASSYDLARKYRCDHKTVLHWVAQYESHGAEALRSTTKNQSYTSEFKKLVVEEYLRGGIGLLPLAVKHNIRKQNADFEVDIIV